MKKSIGTLLIVIALVFSCAFDVIYSPDPEEMVVEDWTVQADETGSEPEAAPQEYSTDMSEPQNIEEPLQEPVVIEEPTGIPEPVIEEPQWIGIDEDQVMILAEIFDEMTDTGKMLSGWFTGIDNTPCTWQGITCEAGRVTELKFENAGYFTTFPEGILDLQDLKELHMIDTLVRGPLPETLFEDLPKLENLELTGNYFTGEIPALPEAFALYPMLREITLSDNLDDSRKAQLLAWLEYADIAYITLGQDDYPGIDLTPGLDGEIPDDWNRLPLLSEIDLSDNQLVGAVPDTFGMISLTKLDLSNNAVPFEISKELYDYLSSLGNSEIKMDGIRVPESPVIVEEPTDEPTAEPMEEPTDEPVILPTEEPTTEPVIPVEVYEPTAMPIPTEEPWVPQSEPTREMIIMPPMEEPTATAVPTEVPPTQIPTEVPPTQIPTQKVVIIVVTATPEPRWYTATPEPRWYTATPYTYNPPVYPNNQPQYYYPTATPYTYYNPNWVYPTATSSYTYTYPQYTQNQQPTSVPTAIPTQDPVSLLGFTYVLEAMTDNNIPMTWRYTGMSEYSINYLDASGNLYPAFAMEWTEPSKICNASACNATVSVPDDLLQQGKFSLQLRVRDASGRTYVSDPVTMEVSVQVQTPTPEPEQPKSFLAGFFEWLFGPIIRLFSGGK